MPVRIPLPAPGVRAVLVAVVACGLLVASVVPTGGGDPGAPGETLFRLAHVSGYAGLATVLAYTLADSHRSRWLTLAAVLGVTICYGAVVELLQAPVPSRAFDTADMLLNGIGAGIAVLCWAMFERLVTFYHVDVRAWPVRRD